jgi:transglutaminase-like putative cysteine protease
MSGVIFFFVSQQALDLTFALFLTGFTTLTLSFFALAYLIDQVEESDVHWFSGKLSFAWFWTAVFVASMLASAGIFMVMPKNLRDPVNGAQAVVLPMRASSSLQLPQVSPEFKDPKVAMPLTADSRVFEDETASASPGSGEDGANDSQTGTDDGPDGDGSESANQAGERDVAGDEPGFGAMRDIGGEPLPPVDMESVVVQVRSPVMTYWRAQAYDRFTGEAWESDDTYMPKYTQNDARAIYAAPQPPGVGSRPLYNQTFFMRQTVPESEIFTGYSAMVAAVPIPEPGLNQLHEGAVYRAISSIPDFDREALANADPSSRLQNRYHRIPRDMLVLRRLESQVTAGVFSDVERVRNIVAYLDRHYTLDLNAPDQLLLSRAPDEFLADESSGTVLDFATATVLMARSAGVPARLVVGYLPGEFDVLSGTYIVRERERHAWAEVYFGGMGWVPFDATPRLAASAFGEGGTIDPGRVASFAGNLQGDEILDAVKSAPGKVMEAIEQGLERSGGMIAVAFVAIALLAGAAFLYWKLLYARSKRTFSARYQRLEGDGREAVIATYSRAERLLSKAGYAPRPAAAGIGEYFDFVSKSTGLPLVDFGWLRNAASRAAYDPNASMSAEAIEARAHLEALKQALKQKKPNDSNERKNT